MNSNISYNKIVNNLGNLRDGLYNANILINPVVDILNIVSNLNNVIITYSNNLTKLQNSNVNNFIENYVDIGFISDILKVQTVNDIIIREEAHKTGGAYQLRGVNFDAFPGKDSEGNYTIFPYETQFPFIIDIPYSALNGIFPCRSEHFGDKLSGYVLPQNQTAVGVCISDVTDGDTILYVNSSVLAMVEVDHLARITLLEMSSYRTSDKVEVISVNYTDSSITVKYPINFENGGVMLASNTIVVQLDNNIIGVITSNVTTDNRWINVDPFSLNYMALGRYVNLFQHSQSRTELRMIIKIDKEKNKIMIDKPFNIPMNINNINKMNGVNGMTTYIQLTIKMIHDIELDDRRVVNAGLKTIGAGSLQDVVIVMIYTNNGIKNNRNGTPTSIKRCTCELHILY
jgi:hypothetical protein